MIFSSLNFFLFFSAFYLLYLFCRLPYQNWLLVAGSLIFYASFDWRLPLLLSILTFGTFYTVKTIADTEIKEEKKNLLFLAIAINIGTLCVFKYFNFFAPSFVKILSSLNIPLQSKALSLAVPVGLSFYVFQNIGYALDIYRGSIKPEQKLADYFLYISFFPKLIAGPIERAANFLPQVKKREKLSSADLHLSGFLILWGLYQKVSISHSLGQIVDSSYKQLSSLSSIEALVCAYAFAFQLYLDFAGYSNMARGISILLGFKIMENFKNPFFATDLLEFWKRWHISLTSWLRDYIFYPFFFNCKNIVLASMLVFFLNGIWHGATLNFAIMGLYWGMAVSITTLINTRKRKSNTYSASQPSGLKWLLLVLFTFHLNCIGFLLFRSQSLQEITSIFARLLALDFKLNEQLIQNIGLMLFMLCPLLVIEFFQFRKDDTACLIKLRPFHQFLLASFLFFQALSAYMYSPEPLLQNSDRQEFVYFRF
ncbi:MAG: hypothetical protein K2X27_20685 [Candidatus Obscuribacterales bacterium]|nr:hypothetical protein [Candidatus Obscuribacterales bacterium]